MSAVADAIEALRQAMLDEGQDPGAVEAKLHMVKPTETNIVGNYADLQRLGAIATTGTMPTPPGEADLETTELTDAFVEPQPQGDDATDGTNQAALDSDSMSKADLQAELDARGIDYPAAATKADLVALLDK